MKLHARLGLAGVFGLVAFGAFYGGGSDTCGTGMATQTMHARAALAKVMPSVARAGTAAPAERGRKSEAAAATGYADGTMIYPAGVYPTGSGIW